MHPGTQGNPPGVAPGSPPPSYDEVVGNPHPPPQTAPPIPYPRNLPQGFNLSAYTPGGDEGEVFPATQTHGELGTAGVSNPHDTYVPQVPPPGAYNAQVPPGPAFYPTQTPTGMYPTQGGQVQGAPIHGTHTVPIPAPPPGPLGTPLSRPPSDFRYLAWFSLLFNVIIGLLALHQSKQCIAAKERNDIHQAIQFSIRTRKLVSLAIVSGCAIYGFLVYTFVFKHE